QLVALDPETGEKVLVQTPVDGFNMPGIVPVIELKGSGDSEDPIEAVGVSCVLVPHRVSDRLAFSQVGNGERQPDERYDRSETIIDNSFLRNDEKEAQDRYNPVDAVIDEAAGRERQQRQQGQRR